MYFSPFSMNSYRVFWLDQGPQPSQDVCGDFGTVLDHRWYWYDLEQVWTTLDFTWLHLTRGNTHVAGQHTPTFALRSQPLDAQTTTLRHQSYTWQVNRQKCPPHCKGILVDNTATLDPPNAPSFTWLPLTPSDMPLGHPLPGSQTQWWASHYWITQD